MPAKPVVAVQFPETVIPRTPTTPRPPKTLKTVIPRTPTEPRPPKILKTVIPLAFKRICFWKFKNVLFDTAENEPCHFPRDVWRWVPGVGCRCSRTVDTCTFCSSLSIRGERPEADRRQPRSASENTRAYKPHDEAKLLG